MNQRDLTERLDALQKALSDLIEAGSTDLDSNIQYYDLLRKTHVLEYYCKKEGYSNLGLHHIPASRVSEHNAKTAIHMGLVLRSLAKSAYAAEPWSLQDTSSDLFASPPKNCFKKGGYEVTVWFDDDKDNAFPYINWSYIYYQDSEDKWHKTEGKVDYDGLYYIEHDGSKSYFLLFYEDSVRYSKNNVWSVHYKNEHIYLPVTSASRRAGHGSPPQTSSHATRDTSPNPPPHRRRSPQATESSSGSSQRQQQSTIGRRRRREGESTTSKRRRRLGGGSGVPSPDEVGRSHRSVTRTNLTRLELLQAEARDPVLILLRGSANQLKCWRYRCHPKCGSVTFSTVFKWVSDKSEYPEGRMLLAFGSVGERDSFLQKHTLPKGTSYTFGSLDAL